eukprot:809608_1
MMQVGRIIFIILLCASYGYEHGNDGLNLLFLGDWGGRATAPYTTTIQLTVRNAMDYVASMHNITAIVSLGDNFYSNGVLNEFDSRFDTTFESVYNTSNLHHIPWYPVAGNHDWHRNVTAQIEYSKHSTKWNMPWFYYSKTFQIPNSNNTMQLLLLDTFIFCGLVENMQTTDECNPSNITRSDIQYRWLQNELDSSTATYIIVGAHVPIYSYGAHGPQQQLIANLNTLLMQYDNVISYVCGHDHNMQFIEVRNQTLQYALSGGGIQCRMQSTYLLSPHNPNHSEALKYYGCNQGGFIRLFVNATYAKMHFYEGIDHQVKFETGLWFPNHSYLSLDGLLMPSSTAQIQPTFSPSVLHSVAPSALPTSPRIMNSSISQTSVPTVVDHGTSTAYTGSNTGGMIYWESTQNGSDGTGTDSQKNDRNRIITFWIVIAIGIVLLICIVMYCVRYIMNRMTAKQISFLHAKDSERDKQYVVQTDQQEKKGSLQIATQTNNETVLPVRLTD